MNVVTEKLYFAVLLLFIFSFLVISCKRNENTAKTVDSDSNIVFVSEEKETLIFGPNRDKETSSRDNTTKNKGFIETEQGDIKGQLFPVISLDIIPDDMVIGSLLDMNTLNKPSGSFVNAIIAFFREVQKGTINEDILHPAGSESIVRLYGDRLYKVNFSLRIGTIMNKNGISTANIRLLSDIGRVSGDIMAENYEGNWLLSSISINMDQLENVYFRENPEFMPLRYSNILLNY